MNDTTKICKTSGEVYLAGQNIYDPKVDVVALRARVGMVENFSIVIVTHSVQQAARISQQTAFFHMGEIIQSGDTKDIFNNPQAQILQYNLEEQG